MAEFIRGDDDIWSISTEWGDAFELACWQVGPDGRNGWYLCSIDTSSDEVISWRRIPGDETRAMSEARRIIAGMEREWRV